MAGFPIKLQLLPGRVGLPPGIRNNRNSGQKTPQVPGSLHDKRVRHPGEFANLLHVGAAHFSAKGGALLINRV